MRYLDTIDTEVAYKESRTVRQQIRRNRSRGIGLFRRFQASNGAAASAAEIRPLFDPQVVPPRSSTKGARRCAGSKLLKYRFNCRRMDASALLYCKYQRSTSRASGHVFIDDVSDGLGANVNQLDEEASEFPAEFDDCSKAGTSIGGIT